MTRTPRISIITPSFNQGNYLERTILSVLGQQYSDLEYIIIDGGSNDQSVDIIKRYAAKLTYWISEKDRGQSHAINKGLSRVTGDVVGWIGSDDWYEDGAFKVVADQFMKSPNQILVGDCTRHYMPEGRQKVLKPPKPTFQRLSRYWLSNFCPPQPSIFFPAALIRQVGFLDENLNYAMDLDLWLRMVRVSEFTYVPGILSHYLIHTQSKSGSGSGFKKFRKEWKTVCFRHARTAPLPERIAYFAEYYYQFFFRPWLVSTSDV